MIAGPDGTVRRETVPAVPIGGGLQWSPDGMWIAYATVYAKSDGPVTAIHLTLINPFADRLKSHTLLRDLADSSAFARRQSQTASP